jgi:hypothetical protein
LACYISQILPGSTSAQLTQLCTPTAHAMIMPNHALLNIDQARSGLVMNQISMPQAARASLHFSVGPNSGTPDCLLSPAHTSATLRQHI